MHPSQPAAETRTMAHHGIAALPLLIVALLACHSVERTPHFPRAPIVLISIDTLRADRLPAYGYTRVATPAIDELARTGIVYENAYSHYPLTLPSHSTMLSGLLPPRHGVRDNLGYQFSTAVAPCFPTQLSAKGYRTGGFVSSFVLRKETGIGDCFETYESEIELERGTSLASGQRSGLETAAKALTWLRSADDRPSMLFLHFYEPHTPYHPPEPFRSRYADEPYDGEVATVDAVLQGLFDQLRDLGLYERSIIALVGDHGEGLGDHSEMQHGVFLYRSTLHVPLILKLPGGLHGGTRIAAPVGLVDLAPSLLKLAGVSPPDGLDGRPLPLSAAAADPTRVVYAETYYPRLHYGWSDLQAAYDSSWSLLDGPQPELFALAPDLEQSSNVVATNRRDYFRLLETIEKTNLPLADPESVDAETAAKLAGLGYLSSPSVRSEGELPDPRSQRALLRDIERGLQAYMDGRLDDAIRDLRAALAKSDKMYDVWQQLSRALNQAGRPEEALVAMERMVELSGGAVDATLELAGQHVKLGQYDRARQLAEAVRARDTKNADSLLAQVDLALGRTESALARIEIARREGRLTEGMALEIARRAVDDQRSGEAVTLLQPFEKQAAPATLRVLGLALSDQGRHEEGLALLQRAVAKESEAARIHEALGIVLLRLDRAPEARQSLERALALDPGLAEAWNTLGVALFKLASPAAAIGAWRKATALDASQFEALFNIGLVALQMDDHATARRALADFAARAPRDRYGPDVERARAILLRLGS